MMRKFRWSAVSCAPFLAGVTLATGCHQKMTVPMQSYPPSLRNASAGSDQSQFQQQQQNGLLHKHSAAAVKGSVQAGDPLQYSLAEFIADKSDYDTDTSKDGLNLDLAKQKRNEMVYGLMTDIELKYAHDFKLTFGSRNGYATAGDFVTLGTTATGAIATNAATKTIMAALGTAVAGLSLSIQKNYFSDQSFQVLAVAMQTVRKKQKKQILANLNKSVTDYPFNAAKEELQTLVLDGTVPRALAELQKEATKANAEQEVDDATKAPDAVASLTVRAGIGQNALTWTPVANAKSYNVYESDSDGVTTKSKLLRNTSQVYISDSSASTSNASHYNVTAIAANSLESPLTGEQQMTAVITPVGAAPASIIAPTDIQVFRFDAGVVIIWTAPATALQFTVYRDTKIPDGTETPLVTQTANVYYDPNPPSGDNYYAVKGVNNAAPASLGQSPKITVAASAGK